MIMMPLLSLAWWSQKLSGVMAQAIAVTVGIAMLISGLAWLRHDARLDERHSWQLKMADARAQNIILTRKKEKAAYELGSKAEKNLVEELDVLTQINGKLEAELFKRPTRVIVYPRAMVPELNR